MQTAYYKEHSGLFGKPTPQSSAVPCMSWWSGIGSQMNHGGSCNLLKAQFMDPPNGFPGSVEKAGLQSQQLQHSSNQVAGQSQLDSEGMTMGTTRGQLLSVQSGALVSLGAVALLVVAWKCFQCEHELPEVQESPTIEGYFIHPNNIHKESIDFEKGVEATLDPTNFVLKNKFSTYYKGVMPSGTSYSAKKLNWTDKIFKSGSYSKLGAELEKQGRLSYPNIMRPWHMFCRQTVPLRFLHLKILLHL